MISSPASSDRRIADATLGRGRPRRAPAPGAARPRPDGPAPRRAAALRELRIADDLAAADRRRARPGLRRVVPARIRPLLGARRPAPAPPARPPRRPASTRSPLRARCSTSAPATGRCSTRSPPPAGPRWGSSAESDRADVRADELAELEDRYAAVVLWHSLEHLRDAGAELGRAVGLLEPGGVIVIAMPNPASLQARVFGDRWLHLDLPRHLVHVPAPALLARLRALGAPVERVSYLRGGQVVFGWLHGIVGLAARPSRPLRRDPPAAGAEPADLGHAAARHPRRRRGRAGAGGRLRSGRGSAAPRGHRLRRGSPWLSERTRRRSS